MILARSQYLTRLLHHCATAMPRPNDTPEVKQSKALSYILRHGAEKEGLHIRNDGLIKLKDVLARPRVKNLALDEPTVFRLVEDNAKKRFEVVYGYDPSPPKPKKKQQPRKKPARVIPGAPVPAPIEQVQEELSQAVISEEPAWTELEFVKLPPPVDGVVDPKGAWYIRAVQGHSIKLEGTDHLELLKNDEEGRLKAGELVHGTQWRLWETLKEQGLSRMNRQHVHLAPALRDHQILPRPNSTLLIFLDLDKMLTADPPIPVYAAANGVLLSPGNEAGFVPKEFWRKAVHVEKGERIVVWEDGKAVERPE